MFYLQSGECSRGRKRLIGLFPRLYSQPENMSDSSTADVGPVEAGVRKLSELRVIDLKAELKRRNLDISGNKSLLSERLKKASGPREISISHQLSLYTTYE